MPGSWSAETSPRNNSFGLCRRTSVTTSRAQGKFNKIPTAQRSCSIRPHQSESDEYYGTIQKEDNDEETDM